MLTFKWKCWAIKRNQRPQLCLAFCYLGERFSYTQDHKSNLHLGAGILGCQASPRLGGRPHFSFFWPLSGSLSKTMIQHLYHIYLTSFLEMSTISHHGWASWGQLLVWIYLWAMLKPHRRTSDLLTSKVKRKPGFLLSCQKDDSVSLTLSHTSCIGSVCIIFTGLGPG